MKDSIHSVPESSDSSDSSSLLLLFFLLLLSGDGEDLRTTRRSCTSSSLQGMNRDCLRFKLRYFSRLQYMKSMQKGVKKYPKLAYKQWINFEDWGGKGAKQYRTIYDIWKTSNKDTIFSVYYTKFLPKMQVIHTNNARLTMAMALQLHVKSAANSSYS